MARTPQERAADELDLDVFRLARRIDDFADKYVPLHERGNLRDLAQSLKSGRYHIRKYMNTEDREATL